MKLTTTFHFYNNYWTHGFLSKQNYFVCGWADHNGIILAGQNFLNIIESLDINNNVLLEKFVSDLNGEFSIVISNTEKTIIAADRMRMYPIVYFIENDALIITDNIEKWQEESKIYLLPNETILEQYLFSDYVFGYYTIYKDVFSTQAGEIVMINHHEEKINRKQYFKWLPNMLNDSFTRNLEEEAQKQDKIFTSVFNRMLKSAPYVHNWVIPLSGGYDSRTIANYLYKLGAKNVICFSYGIKGNIQSKISSQVSNALGYEWYFIDYEQWIEKIQQTNHLEQFLSYAFNGTSIAHLQDFTAVYAMKQLGILQENDIFVPGHALEVLAGYALNPKMQNCLNTMDVLPMIAQHFAGFSYSNKIRNRTNILVKSIMDDYHIHPSQMAEYFYWQERQTKFAAYSVKVYEYFGYQWRMPEWDLELFNYWQNIGFNYRFRRNMYKTIFNNSLRVAAIKDIPYANDIIHASGKSLTKLIMENLPIGVKRFIKKLGYTKSNNYTNEGVNLIYSNKSESISDYIQSFPIPETIKIHLKEYPPRQRLSSLPVNSVTTLLNIRK